MLNKEFVYIHHPMFNLNHFRLFVFIYAIYFRSQKLKITCNASVSGCVPNGESKNLTGEFI